MTKVISALLALTGFVAVWTIEAPACAADKKSAVQQADKSRKECIARRQREGLNIRFAVSRCVNPNN